MADPLMINDIFFGYRGVYRSQLPILAQTGFGVICRAEDQNGRTVALKCITDGDVSAFALYQRELTALGLLELNTPQGAPWPPVSRFVDNYDDSREDGPFIALQYELGEEFSKLLDRKGAITPSELKQVYSFCGGLQRAHELGIAHRDVKPANVRLTPEGAKLMDFGLATHPSLCDMDADDMEEGVMLGTPEYLAPELIQGLDATSPKLDVYALGIMAFEALVGRVPFRDSNNVSNTLRMHIYEAMPVPSEINPSIPRELSDLILAATEKDPKDRPFKDAGEFYAALMRTPNERSTIVTVPALGSAI